MKFSVSILAGFLLLLPSGTNQSANYASLAKRVTALEKKLAATKVVVDNCTLSDFNVPPRQSHCDERKNEVLVKIEGGSEPGAHKSFCCEVRLVSP